MKQSQRQRRTNSRANECKFKIQIKLYEAGDWEVEICHEEHNHQPSQDFRAHPTHRRAALTDADKEIITHLYEAGASTRVVRSVLREKYGFCPVTSHDLYNFSATIIARKLQGRSPIQALIDEIEISRQSAIISDRLIDKDKRITHLLLIHRKSVEILHQNHDILLLDCTYKTNQYRMPLLNILFVTNTHKTINLGFVFMNSEKKWDYQ